jgi:hypothetical protein
MSKLSHRRWTGTARSRAHLLIIGGCLASLALAASSPAQAALPEVGRCVKVALGKGAYRDGKCLTHETGTRGKWEWMPASTTENLSFSGGGSAVKIATAGHEAIECAVANLKGTFTGPKTATSELELQGCANAKGESCGSAGNENEIKSNPLEAEYGFIENIVVEGRRIVKVGLDFKPQSPQTSLAMYKCGTESSLPNASIEGSVIAGAKPIDAMKEEAKLSFHVRFNGVQDPESFQESGKDTLSTTFMSGLETTGPFATTLGIQEYTGKYSQPLEIKALEK